MAKTDHKQYTVHGLCIVLNCTNQQSKMRSEAKWGRRVINYINWYFELFWYVYWCVLYIYEWKLFLFIPLPGKTVLSVWRTSARQAPKLILQNDNGWLAKSQGPRRGFPGLQSLHFSFMNFPATQWTSMNIDMQRKTKHSNGIQRVKNCHSFLRASSRTKTRRNSKCRFGPHPLKPPTFAPPAGCCE